MFRKECLLDGKKILLETGKIANNANAAVVVQSEDTLVLVTVVAEEEPKEAIDFLPLTVDYQEKMSAAGKIPGGFVKRETRPKNYEILNSRLIDRSIRPLFPKNYHCDTQISATVFSYGQGDPAILSLLGASAALHLSDIPWNGPCAGARILQNQKKFVTFTADTEESTDFDFVISLSKTGLIMMEGESFEASELVVMKALEYVEEVLRPFFTTLEEWRNDIGKPKRLLPEPPPRSALWEFLEKEGKADLEKAFTTKIKMERRTALKQITRTLSQKLLETFPEEETEIPHLLEQYKHDLVRHYMVREQQRIDGRRFHDIRPISGEVSWLPRAHGSAIFTRGETQALVSCTLGTSEDEAIEDHLYGDVRERFLLHYNFPGYSVGEVKPNRAPGRREIGHGNLALRALKPMLPDALIFPYTLRIVSDISQSNGSSSMATVCGGCMSLMNAGVPLQRPVAGIAMGLISEKDQYLILSDILGDEDHLGDMDFKVCGTTNGITAIQLDNKLGALPPSVLEKALDQAKQGRLFILDKMKTIIDRPAPQISPYAPQFHKLQIRKEQIREVIGAGGKTIQGIQEACQVKINIQDQGLVQIFGPNQEAVQKALQMIRNEIEEPLVGGIYEGQIVSVKEFGVFVRFLPRTEGLVHVTELSDLPIKNIENLYNEGQALKVKVLGVDPKGKIKLSHKQAL